MAIEQSTEIKFLVSSGEEISLMSALGVFTPNATTNLLIDAVKSTFDEPVQVLDLGCGTGVVGIALHLQGLVKLPVHASDLSKPAVVCSGLNFERYKCPAEVREGSLFEPWLDKKFEVIVDDISGIAKSVAEISPWFQGVPCETGDDGVDLVVEIIRKASQHLEEGGHFFFPVLSLSNVDRIIEVANESFGSVERVGRQDWPLPAELKEHIPLLRKLKEEGSIKLEERFGMVLCYTEVYCAKKPLK
ncbi:MAG: methyltransferase [Gammaproteobacteria bacterium]|nr:methyltransferase [Gammaproteobacteria bacterium]